MSSLLAHRTQGQGTAVARSFHGDSGYLCLHPVPPQSGPMTQGLSDTWHLLHTPDLSALLFKLYGLTSWQQNNRLSHLYDELDCFQ